MPIELVAGTVVGERYRLERLLGEGGMGAVWAATHALTRKTIALKFLKGAAAERPDVVRRFLREARAASAVRHPNVVQIHDIIHLDDGVPVMVMDLLVGESLGDRMAREHSIPLADLARILAPIVSAVGTAHALGIVHRDLKPDNIFLERLADGRVEPKVLDFGIAKLTATEGDAAQTAGLTHTGSVLGTPYFMAPEQAFGDKGLDHRADVWAIGVILYYCLTGVRPVDGDTLGALFRVLMTGAIRPIDEVAPGLPEDVRKLISKMLLIDRHLRLPDLREAFEVLKRHSDTAAASFGPAVSPVVRHTEVPDPAGSDPGSARDAARPPSSDSGGDAAVARSGRAFETSAETSMASTNAPSKRSRRAAWIVAAGVGLAGATALGFATIGARTPDPGLAGGPETELAATALPPPVPTPSASIGPAPPAETAAAAQSSGITTPAGSTIRRPPKLPPAASAAPAASAPVSATPTAKALPGGVQSAIPF